MSVSFALARRSSGPARGRPVVTLHGLFASAANWRPLETHLPELRWHHLDLRNHGLSPHAATMSLDEMAEDVLKTLPDIDAPALLGHSLGGKVAMRCCELHPGRFSCLIIEDIAPFRYPNRHLVELETMLSLPLAVRETRQSLEKRMLDKISDPAVVRFLMTNLKTDTKSWSWRCELKAISRALPGLLDYPDDARQNPCPVQTTFVFGKNSAYYPTAEALRAISGIFPNHRVHDIEDTGHWVHHEKPAEFARLVREALIR